MLLIPLQAIPAQSVNVSLAGQACLLTIRQFDTGLYMTVASNGSTVLNGVFCLNAVKIIRNLYFGFIGDFAFFDTEPDPVTGPAAPDYTGLAERFLLAYLTPDDLGGFG